VCKRPNPALPATFSHVGDYIRTARVTQKITLRNLAKQLEVDINSLFDWEMGLASPLIIQYPKIISFLGHDPLFKDPDSLRERVLHYRRSQGMTRKELADLTGVDTHTLGRLEKGRRSYSRTTTTLEAFLEKASIIKIN